MENINREKINDLIKSQSTFVVQFSASWCGPCRALTPILENVCDGNNIEVYKFDIGDDPEFARELKITSIPFVHFYKQGLLTETKVGMAPREFYEEQTTLLKD